jgi:hypothetical protein
LDVDDEGQRQEAQRGDRPAQFPDQPHSDPSYAPAAAIRTRPRRLWRRHYRSCARLRTKSPLWDLRARTTHCQGAGRYARRRLMPTITLPLPPSVNRLWRVGRPRAGRLVANCIAAAPSHPRGMVSTIAAGRPDRRRKDLDHIAPPRRSWICSPRMVGRSPHLGTSSIPADADGLR